VFKHGTKILGASKRQITAKERRRCFVPTSSLANASQHLEYAVE